MYCPACGSENHDDNINCTQCGASLDRSGSPVLPRPPATSGKAVASLVCSIVGLVMCPLVGQVAGLILGYSARNEIRASGGTLTGEGIATAGIIVGWIGIVLGILSFILWFGLFALEIML